MRKNELLKRIASLVVTSILCISLVACSANANVDSNADNKDEITAVEKVEENQGENEAAETTEENTDISAEENEAVISDEKNEDKIIYPDPGIKANLPDSKPSVNEDLFLYYNYDKLKSMELPAGYSALAALNEMALTAEEDTKTLLEGDNFKKDIHKKAAILYKMYQDTDKRNKDGWSGIKPYIDKINNAESMDDIIEAISEKNYYFDNTGIISLYSFPDRKDSSRKVFYLDQPALFLEDSEEYRNMSEYGEILKKADDDFFVALLKGYGYSEDEAKKMTELHYEFEALKAEHIFSDEIQNSSDYNEKSYNVYSREKLSELYGDFPITEIMDSLGCEKSDKYIVDNPDYAKNVSVLYSNENLEAVKASIIITSLSMAASEVDLDTFKIYNEWENAKSGSTGMKSLDKLAYEEVSDSLAEVVGDLYATEYFSKEEKEDAEAVIYNIINAYRKRLESNDWMSDETKKLALEKLDSIKVHAGYPDVFVYDYSNIDVNEDNDYLTNVINISEEKTRQAYVNLEVPENTDAWGEDLAANVVNACYRWSYNDINFPAAILKDPVFSINNSIAANYGGLGAIAGHELTHGFDTNGSQYDKDGNLNNWWTDEDLEKFTVLAENVADRYAKYALVGNESSSPDLIIGEAVADLGGVATALDVLKEYKNQGEDINYEDFFSKNAYIWCRMLTRENSLKRLKTDPHPANCLRTNINLTQFDEFYETYDVKEGDKMYTAPEDRLSVW